MFAYIRAVCECNLIALFVKFSDEKGEDKLSVQQPSDFNPESFSFQSI